jgi:hypothetical protein
MDSTESIYTPYNSIYNWLVVEPYPSEKYESVGMMIMIIPNMIGNIIQMFQTTNQIWFVIQMITDIQLRKCLMQSYVSKYGQDT